MRVFSVANLLLAVVICLTATAGAQDDPAALEEKAFAAAVEIVSPSVVKIETIGGLESVAGQLINTGPTTGLVIAEDGYVISSAFNFIQQPASILVTLPGGSRAPAQIVARDHSRMLVLLKVNSKDKLTVPIAVPRSEWTVGQWAIAVGRTYDSPRPNVSVGVLSAIGRIWSTALQTDAKISPANYGGPLIDIQGRVLGVLVPLSPQKQGGEVAGAEWYDSGIGFAVPLSDIVERLPTLRGGKDLRSGLLGISLKSGDVYSLPAELASARPGGPAYKAGLKAGDTIVAIDDTPIVRQSQLKHALGPHYGGDKIRVAYTRGKEKSERREATIELAEKLIAYQHPFLGLLPLRDGEGVRVRYVYQESAADKAGLKAGDKITAIDGAAIASAGVLRDAVANVEPKAKVKLAIERSGAQQTLELTPGKLPTDIPGELPKALGEPSAPAAEKPPTGMFDIKIPEEPNHCFAFVPESYHPDVPHGVVVYLPAPGAVGKEAEREKLIARWKPVCEERQLILLVPQAAAAEKWQTSEAAFVRKTLEDVLSHYNVDSTRVVTYGYQTGGAMAYIVGFEHVDRVRGVVAVDAALPQRVKLPDNDPVNRLAFFIAQPEKSANAPVVKLLVERLEEDNFPITQKSLGEKAAGEKARDLSAEELAEVGRWIDTLDRI
jgi:serine protease Do